MGRVVPVYFSLSHSLEELKIESSLLCSRASAMVENSEITKAAQAKAAEIEKNALIKARAVKNAADEYIIDVLTKTEETLAESLTSVKRTKGSIKMPRTSNPNIPQQNPNISNQQR